MGVRVPPPYSGPKGRRFKPVPFTEGGRFHRYLSIGTSNWSIFLLTHSPGLVECFRYPKHYHWTTRKFSRALSISTYIWKASFFTDFKPFRNPNYANVSVRIFKNQPFFTFATIESVLDVVRPWNFFLSKGMILGKHLEPLVAIWKCVKIFFADLKVMGVTTKTHKFWSFSE